MNWSTRIWYVVSLFIIVTIFGLRIIWDIPTTRKFVDALPWENDIDEGDEDNNDGGDDDDDEHEHDDKDDKDDDDGADARQDKNKSAPTHNLDVCHTQHLQVEPIPERTSESPFATLRPLPQTKVAQLRKD